MVPPLTMHAFVLALFLSALAAVQAALFPPKTPVVQLTQSNFKREVLDIEKPTLVMYSAPWCGHCKRLAPDFHKAASTLDGIVKFANVDCDQDVNKGLCAQYQIQGFPTLKLFPATKKRLPREYRGERNAKAMVDYVKEQLPLGARKVAAEELENYVNEEPGRPKVILFSNKPKSSPLYRSLALDFRKTMDFAFMRGDEPLVRSSARLSLGVDIATEKDLPILIAVPARFAADGGDGEVPAIEKSSFETYAGVLKYWKIKAWLDEVGPKIGAGKSSKATTRKAEATKKSSTKKPVKSAGKSKYGEEVIPEGGSVEWKAQKPKDQGRNMVKEAIQAREDAEAAAAEAPDAPIMDESKPKKDSFKGQMLDIERAGEIADEIRKQQESATRKRKGQYVASKGDGAADAETQKEAESLVEKARAAVGAAMDTAAQAVKEASESISDHLDGVPIGEAVNSAKEATQKVFDSASRAYKGASESISERVGEAGEAIRSSDKPFDKKRQALMKQFEKWMSGEHAGWEEELGEEFEKAQVEAEELLKRNPEEARRQAWESEEWLLREMMSDRKRMESVMTGEQKAQVEGMIELVQSRLKERGTKDVFERSPDLDPSAAIAHEEEEREKKHDEL